MQRGNYFEPDVVLLYLSQPFELEGPFDTSTKEIPLGWLEYVQGKYEFVQEPTKEEESLQHRTLVNTASAALEKRLDKFTLWEGFPAEDAVVIARRFNENEVRLIYWDIDVDKEMARRIIALSGTRMGKIVSGPAASRPDGNPVTAVERKRHEKGG